MSDPAKKFIFVQTVFTLLTFPVPCMALWRVSDIDAWIQNSRKQEDLELNQDSTPKFCMGLEPVIFEIYPTEKPTCETLFPTMWQSIQFHQDSIVHVATLREPGPFTALRAGQAFARALVHGDNRWSFYETSLFDLMPDSVRDTVLLDTSSHHWVNAAGVMHKRPESEYVVSSETSTRDQVLMWSQQLAHFALTHYRSIHC